MRTRGMAAALMVVLLVGALAACGDDGDAASTTTTSGVTTTTGEATTTTTTGEATTTTAGGGEALGDEPTFHDDGPSGSGCTPGDADVLPDGWWYGTLVVPPGVGLGFDLACYYVGPAAEAAATARGDEVTDDYYVVDDSTTERSLTIADDATASCVQVDAGLEMVDCTPPDVDGQWAVWIRVVDGAVDRMIEQYAP